MLDVSNNTALEALDCSNTGISLCALDVSKNSDLQFGLLQHRNPNAGCQQKWKTGQFGMLQYKNTITGCQQQYCFDIFELFQHSIGLSEFGYWENLSLYQKFHIPKTSNIDLAVTSDSFDMTQAFPDIDISKVKNIKGAVLNSNIITGYTLGKPITYTYDCGTANGNPVTLDVTLNPHKTDSEIQITGTFRYDLYRKTNR